MWSLFCFVVRGGGSVSQFARFSEGEVCASQPVSLFCRLTDPLAVGC